MPLPHRRPFRWFLVLFAVAAIAACGGGGSSDDDDDAADDNSSAGTTTSGSNTTADTASIARGKTLYANNCASCHGSNMPQARSASATLQAISANRGGMGSLAGVVGSTQANDIATYLSFGL